LILGRGNPIIIIVKQDHLRVFDDFLSIMQENADENLIKRKIQEFRLVDRLGEAGESGIPAVALVPAVIRILNSPAVLFHTDLVRASVAFLGDIRPDGLITRDCFTGLATDTGIDPGDIVKELESKGYLERNFVTPAFCPTDEGFLFRLDSRFEGIRDTIREIVLSASVKTDAVDLLVKLMEEDYVKAVQPEIAKALEKMRMPQGMTALYRLAAAGERFALESLVRMILKDLDDLAALLGKGITIDLWGNDLKEKVYQPIQPLLPLLIRALKEDVFTLSEKSGIIAVLSDMNHRNKEDIPALVHLLPDLMSEDRSQCLLTRYLTDLAPESIVPLTELLVEKKDDERIVRRILFIFSEAGVKATLSTKALKELLDKGHPLGDLIRETLDKIRVEEPEEEPVMPIAEVLDTEVLDTEVLEDEVLGDDMPKIESGLTSVELPADAYGGNRHEEPSALNPVKVQERTEQEELLEVLEDAETGKIETGANLIPDDNPAAGSDTGLKITFVEEPILESGKPVDSEKHKENKDDKKDVDPDTFVLF
jgi:hypothetical protein